jgi:hypothetical protein
MEWNGMGEKERRGVHHIALRMPRLLAHVSVDLDELLKDGRVTASAAVGKAGRVVEVAIDTVFMLVIRVLRTEEGLRTHIGISISGGARGVAYGTYRTGKVVCVKFFACVRVSKCVPHDEQDLSKHIADADARWTRESSAADATHCMQ